MTKSDEVFVIQGNDIRPLAARPFKAGLFGRTLEDALQTLIERQPNIINGRQIDPGAEEPPRFALLCREMQVGDWSLDHLLVDQYGILTFVEAKLLQNREARRAVIGQILDYAASAAEHWKGGRLRELAHAYWSRSGRDVDSILQEALGELAEPEAFWEKVESNLEQGRIRLVIAADEVSPEARRVIEFLNAQFRTIQVFGLELRCFGEDPNTVIVPFLIGQTQAIVNRKAREGAKSWTVDELKAEYSSLPGPLGARLAAILDWGMNRGCIKTGITKNAVFQLIGNSGERIVTISPASYIYLVTHGACYRDTAERDGIVAELKKLQLLPPDFDPDSVADGRNLTRRPEELDDNQLSALLDVFSRYSHGRGAAV